MTGPATPAGPAAGDGRSRRKPGCLAWAFTIVAAVAVLCCAGAGAGAGIEWFTSRPDDAALPPGPAGFPEAGYLPQVDVEAFAGALAGQGYECERNPDADYPLDCSPPDLPGIRNSRLAVTHDQAGVVGVTVVCVPGEEPTSCRQLYAQAIDLALAGHPGEVRKQGKTWAAEHVDASAYTRVGEVELTIRQFDSQTELRIWPA